MAAGSGAEYSIRWDPAQSGPGTPEAALQVLGKKPGKRSRYEVQYFDIATPADAPAGFDAIMRKRTFGSTAQLTYKLRGSTPWPDKTPLAQWPCPLPKPVKSKEEADIAFLGMEHTSKAYSRSCTHSSPQLDIAVPAALQPRPNSCRSTMTRLESGKLKVEEWHLPDGTRLIEVSSIGHDSTKARNHFARRVVEPLLAQQVHPVQRSKSALGSACE
jgi:hypothetical protein